MDMVALDKGVLLLIRLNFGSKYDEQIAEMLDYVDRLEQEGVFNGKI